MKQIYTIGLLLLCHSLLAQVDTVQLGTGNSSFANTLYGPVYRFSATSATTHSRSNMLLTAAQLQAAGLPNGAIIHAIEFSKFSINGMIKTVNFKMYMANSVRDTLDRKRAWTSVLATHTQVYSNTSLLLPLGDGWVSMPVAGFVYNGGAMEVATETEMQGSGGADGGIAWRYAPGTAKFIEGQTGTNKAPDTLNGSNANYLFRPDIRIIYTMGALPVKLLSFSAQRQGKDILINWTVANETNMQGYQLQRSIDGISFSNAAWQQANGNANYTLKDNMVPNAALYYRLQIQEKDGSSSYSKNLLVKPISKNFVALITSHGLLQVQAETSGKVSVQLLTGDGKILYKESKSMLAGNNQFWLPMHGLAKGCYMVCLQQGAKQQVLKCCR
jgi:hypothetical protein